MSRRRPTLFLLLVLGLQGCVHDARVEAPRTPPPWAHEASDLTPDPAVTWGRLENGLRYAILPHRTPQQRASVFLVVQAGSYHEQRGELGYAHYVEHMAFRGMRALPNGEAREVLAQLGVASGAHVNAATSPFETEYFLNNLPTDIPEALPTGLAVMRAIADGVAFEREAVAIERGVIFSEQRVRTSSLAQARPDEMEYLPPQAESLRWRDFETTFPRTRLVTRYPIGTERTLNAATPEKLRAFHDRWYRPERMILAVAGDISAVETERQIREAFATLAGRGRTPAELSFESPKPMRNGSAVTYLEQAEVEPAMRLTLGTARPEIAADSIARRRDALTRKVALLMLSRRLNRTIENGIAPFTAADASEFHIVPRHNLTLLRATTAPDQWTEALGQLEWETRRAATLGFTEVELERAVAREKAQAGATARQTLAQPSAELAGALAFSVARDVVFTAPENDRRLTLEHLQTLTLAECQAALRLALPPGQLTVGLYGPLKDAKRDGRQAATALAAALQKPVVSYPPLERAQPFPYTDFGPPGQITAQTRLADGDADMIGFANGVRLNLKRSDFEPGHVRVLIRFGGGLAAEPADQPGLSWRTFGWILGGLRNLTADEERAALSAIVGNLTMSISGSGFTVVLEGESDNLPLLLQATTAYLVHPAFRETDWTRSMEIARQVLAPYESTAAGIAQSYFSYRLTSEHASERPPKIAEVGERTLEQLKSWLIPQLNTGPLEITLVGDVESTQAIDLVARTFGALPPRATAADQAALRTIAFPPKPFAETMAFDGLGSGAVVQLAWPLAETLNDSERRHGEILADIFAARLETKLRDQMGETYSPSASLGWRSGFTPLCYLLWCQVEAAPERVDLIVAATREVAETLARDGVSAEEFERGRRPRVRVAETDRHDNAWWVNALSMAQSAPGTAEAAAGALEAYRAANRETLNALAKRIFVKERECRLIVVPAAKRPTE